MKHKIFRILLLIAVLLVSCSGSNPNGASESDVSIVETENITLPIPTLEDGKGTIIGRVIAQSNDKPIRNIAVRLADVVREGDGVFVLDTAKSHGAYTDENGYFIVPNIEPMEYVIVIGDIYGQYEIIEDGSGKAKAWEVTSGENLNVGDFVVDLPHP